MYESQARGYYLEGIVRKLMEKTGYINIDSGKIEGRGARHQIDSYGHLSIPTPFINPIRLLAEVKWYEDDKVRLKHIRNFTSVLRDISQNYFVVDKLSRYEDDAYSTDVRFTNCGAFFSASEFTEPAQHFAWAHNIFLIPLRENKFFKPVIERSEELVNNINLDEENKDSIIEKALSDCENDDVLSQHISNLYFYIGMLDETYPTFILSRGELPFKYDQPDDLSVEESVGHNRRGIKDTREERGNVFDFIIEFENVEFSFTIPKITAKRLIQSIEKKGIEEPFGNLEILSKVEGPNNWDIRRMYNMDLYTSERHEEYVWEIQREIGDE